MPNFIKSLSTFIIFALVMYIGRTPYFTKYYVIFFTTSKLRKKALAGEQGGQLPTRFLRAALLYY